MFALDLLAAAALSTPNVRAQSSPTLINESPVFAPASTPPDSMSTVEPYSSAKLKMTLPTFVLSSSDKKGVVSPFPSNQGLGISLATVAAESLNKRPRLPSLRALPVFQQQLVRPPILMSTEARHHPYQVPDGRRTHSHQPDFHPMSFSFVHPAPVQIPRVVTASSPSIPLATENDDFPCPSCPKLFTRKHHLVSHMVSHSQSEPLRCPIAGCDATFRRNQDRRRHIRKIKHEGVREATLNKILSNL
ncbi:hypothetical protein BC830DRAFT_374094 [Chytriomyces sp. MP71]|nr:hypothetical protein BC830DRAFT_374094 [Chytriomyces sp. MP71]